MDANPAPDSTMSVTVEDTKEADSMVRQKARVATFKKSNEDWFNGREQRIASVYDKASNEIYKTTVEIFSDMAGSLVRTTQKYLKTKHYKPQATKATEVGNPKPKAEVLNRTELKRKLRDAVNQYEERWIGDNVKVLENSVDVGYDVTLSFPFNHTNQQQLDAMREQGVEGRRAILEERSLNTFAHMNRTTTDQILDTIDAGVASNKTVDQISDDIRAKFADEGMTAGRAQTIARTETLTAVSLGQAAAMADAATVIPNLKKMWLTADDDRVRPEHVAVDGEVKSWDAEFTNNLQFPRDPSGPADQVINCRCTFVALPADQIDDVSGDNLSSNEAS